MQRKDISNIKNERQTDQSKSSSFTGKYEEEAAATIKADFLQYFQKNHFKLISKQE